MSLVQRGLMMGLLLALPVSGCFCGVPTPQTGTLSFGWRFAGEDSCTAARVTELDVDVVGPDGVVYEQDRVPCSGAGLTLNDLEPGSYEVFVDAFDDRGTYLYAGSKTGSVSAGETTDFGAVELSRTGADGTGDIAFYWSFGGEESCSTAGVDEVDVVLVGSGDVIELQETVDCFGGGLVIEDVAAGSYALYLDAYNSANQHLFTGATELDVDTNEVTDLGVLELDPVAVNAGALSLSWTFAGQNCTAASVDEVDVEILEDNGNGLERVYYNTFGCADAPVTITDLDAGDYTVYVDGYTAAGDWTYTLDTAATIDLGFTTPLGTVDLLPRSTGVSFTWSFIYPTDAPESDCARAGADQVHVVLESTGGADGFSGSYACDPDVGGLEISPLAPGGYTLQLTAETTYNAAPLELYSLGPQSVTVQNAMINNLGDLELPRVATNFANIDVSWTFDTGMCADIGGDGNVTVTFTRLIDGGDDIVDETTTRPCDAGGTLINTFVPGDYRVDVSGGSYSGSVTIDAAPGVNTAAAVSLQDGT